MKSSNRRGRAEMRAGKIRILDAEDKVQGLTDPFELEKLCVLPPAYDSGGTNEGRIRGRSVTCGGKTHWGAAFRFGPPRRNGRSADVTINGRSEPASGEPSASRACLSISQMYLSASSSARLAF